MISANDCLSHCGRPELETTMILFDVPEELELGVIPKRIYCNAQLVKPLEKALRLIIERNLVKQLKTWDGCFNIRKKKGGATASIHSWGLAVDINAAWNQFGKPPTMSKDLVKCFKESGFDWGGDWTKPDGMHFQLARFPGK